MRTLIKTELSLPLLHRGKVRDIFDIDDNNMLIVTSDRLSAYDVVFDQPIPEKGTVLTSIANYWFRKTEHIIQNHLTGTSLEEVLSKDEAEMLAGRAIVVKKLRPLALEAVVRGYLIGSGWKEYLSSGMVCGIPLPQNMKLAQQLLKPLYTPSSKADVGEHDANISFKETEAIVGSALASQIKDVSLKIYQFAAEHALNCGIIIADTKFEFGLDEDNQADLGLALDGDADRLIAVASDGTTIDGDRQLCLFAKDLAQRNQLTNRSVVATVMSNLGLRQALEQVDITMVEVPVGDRNVLTQLDTGVAILGGEQSGHLVFRNHATTGDGLLSGALLADLVLRSGRKSADIAGETMHQFPQVLISIPVKSNPTELLDRLTEEIAEATTRLDDIGRVLVRASGTEPVIRIMVEAIEEAMARREAEYLADVIRRAVR